jgi:hypothetical protein
MVHALQEAWRVLKPNGIMIDLRPRCDDMPLEILQKDGIESAGLVDMSPDLADDQAADAAIATLVSAGSYQQILSDRFLFTHYWKSLQEFLEDWNERWKDWAILPDDVLQRASLLYKQHDSRARLRLQMFEILNAYMKL